ncbi:copper-binding protein [Sphingobium sp. TKS]|uniref:copper-binding protein n=1 Tax=Sphingobium sp. TKS TaxID=1315974 RepID=UPI00076FEF4F|nr:copper-binding protein [Sphingobium sp. TKS]AMK21624.1 putative copper efflux system periplasmic protein CusF [Sphingobium sp. TKS]
MNKTLMMASSLALMASLAACNKQEDAPKHAESSAASGPMANMPMAGQMMHGMAAGTVTAIDPAEGTITLDHGAMSNLGWPAMTMGFTAKPEQLSGIKVGDKVDFEIDWDGKAGAITKIAKSGS